MMHSLFPDTCYGNESGGDPDYITDLSYEQFCAAHKKYYNPSNSYIFLDGDMDIEQILGIIDEEYLSHYTNEGDCIVIEKQEPVCSDTVVKEYEVSENVGTQGKAQISYGYVIGDFDEYEKIAAFSLITSVLCGSNEAPLKKMILAEGLGEDVSFDVQDGILQPFVGIDIINTDLEKEERIDAAIRKLLEDTIKEGLNKEELEAVLNQREFKAKERDFGRAPKGLVFALSSLDSWLYGGSPVDSLCYDELFASLREKIQTSYYEDLLREFILESRHHAKVMLKPSNTLGKQKAENEREKLRKIAASWSIEEKEKLVEMNRNLQLWQACEDTPEQKASLPALHLEDLKKTPTRYDYEVCQHGGCNTVIKHDCDSNGISYVTLFAECDDFELKEYTILTQLLTLLGQLKTAHYDPLTLNRKMRSILGDFDAGLVPALSYHTREGKTFISISWSSLHRNDMEAVDLIKEILYTTDFSDSQAIRDILKQNIISLEQTFINAGNSLALQRSYAYSSPAAVISEYSSGYEAYRFMKDLDENWEKEAEDFIRQLQEIRDRLFIKERYTVSVNSEDKPSIVKALLDEAPQGTIRPASEKKVLGHRREGIIVPANISYAAKSSFLSDTVSNLGVMYVISNILTYDYLWNNIRVKGGAYGCGFRCGYSKTAGFYSYRDPNPANSCRIYKETTEYLKEFVERGADIENYIVGTTGDFDPLQTNKTAIRSSDMEYMLGVTYEDKKEILSQILNTSLEDIRKAIPLFEQINEDDNVCVIGNKEAIEALKDQLDHIFDLNQKNA